MNERNEIFYALKSRQLSILLWFKIDIWYLSSYHAADTPWFSIYFCRLPTQKNQKLNSSRRLIDLVSLSVSQRNKKKKPKKEESKKCVIYLKASQHATCWFYFLVCAVEVLLHKRGFISFKYNVNVLAFI